MGYGRAFIAAALLLLPLQAIAQSVAPPAALDPRNIERGMRDLTGMMVGSLFQNADADRNGALDVREVAAFASSMGFMGYGTDPRSWRALDLNRDGFVTKAEMTAGLNSVRAKTRMGQTPF